MRKTRLKVFSAKDLFLQKLVVVLLAALFCTRCSSRAATPTSEADASDTSEATSSPKQNRPGKASQNQPPTPHPGTAPDRSDINDEKSNDSNVGETPSGPEHPDMNPDKSDVNDEKSNESNVGETPNGKEEKPDTAMGSFKQHVSAGVSENANKQSQPKDSSLQLSYSSSDITSCDSDTTGAQHSKLFSSTLMDMLGDGDLELTESQKRAIMTYSKLSDSDEGTQITHSTLPNFGDAQKNLLIKRLENAFRNNQERSLPYEYSKVLEMLKLSVRADLTSVASREAELEKQKDIYMTDGCEKVSKNGSGYDVNLYLKTKREAYNIDKRLLRERKTTLTHYAERLNDMSSRRSSR